MEKSRGPSMRPARIISLFVKTVSVSFDGIVRRRDAVREVGGERPAQLRKQPFALATHVRVRVDDAGDDRLAGDVDAPRAGRHAHRARRADGDDAVALDDDGAVLDDRRRRGAGHRDEACADERDRAGGHVARLA